MVLALKMELRNKLILWKPCVLVNHRRLHRNISFPNFNHLFFAICHERKWVMLTKRIFWNLLDEVYLPSANTAFLDLSFYLLVSWQRYQLIPTEGIRTSHTLKARPVFGVAPYLHGFLVWEHIPTTVKKQFCLFTVSKAQPLLFLSHLQNLNSLQYSSTN